MSAREEFHQSLLHGGLSANPTDKNLSTDFDVTTTISPTATSFDNNPLSLGSGKSSFKLCMLNVLDNIDELLLP